MPTTEISSSRLAIDFDAPVAHIVLRHPPLNVIDIPMMEELAQSLAEIDSRPEVSVIVFSGDGKAFSAGVDVAAHTPDKVDGDADEVPRHDSRAGRDEKSHDCRSAWALPGRRRRVGHGVRHGLHHGVGAVGIPRDQAGLLSTRGVYGAGFSGRTKARRGVDSDRADDRRQRGGGDRSGQPLPCLRVNWLPPCEECIGHLRKLSPAALALAKKASYAWDSMHFDKGLARAERIYFDELMKTSDVHEGIRAFMEKREPKWTGK